VEVVAEVAGQGAAARTVLRTVRTQGPALAARRTGPLAPAGTEDGRAPGARVHLVGTAAGPMGGDVVEVRLVVGPGASLEVAGVAATVVLPAVAGTGAQLLLEADVAPGGRLLCVLPPVVVTGRAAAGAAARLRLVGDGQVRVVEHVRLGRYDEPGGRWCGRTDLTRDGVPLLRQTTRLGEDPDDGLRELRSVLDTSAEAPGPPAQDDGPPRSVVMDLARGGCLTVTLG
jgi:urease accessory protein